MRSGPEEEAEEVEGVSHVVGSKAGLEAPVPV